jgi:hypothetical protein
MGVMNESNLDILITRVIDRRATATDWVELESLAASDPSVWRELAAAQKHDAALAHAVGEAVAAADHVSIPHGTHAGEAGVRRRLGLVATWGGWAAAAAVALMFATQGRPARNDTPAGTQMAGLPLPEMLSQYIDQGKKQGTVVGELPDKIVLDSTKTADGGTEIVFVRQIVERARVDDLYRMTTDEAGNPQAVKIQLKVVGRKSAM